MYVAIYVCSFPCERVSDLFVDVQSWKAIIEVILGPQIDKYIKGVFYQYKSMTLVVIRGLADCPPKFFEKINFLPVYLLPVQFQLKEGQRAIFHLHIHRSLSAAMYAGIVRHPWPPDVSPSDPKPTAKFLYVADKELRQERKHVTFSSVTGPRPSAEVCLMPSQIPMVRSAVNNLGHGEKLTRSLDQLSSGF